MDARSIARLMNLSPEKTQRLTQAWQQAQLVAQGVVTQQDALNALSANGIDSKFIAQVSRYLNHPFASMVAKGAGLNLDKIRSDFNNLQQAADGMAAVSAMGQTIQPAVPQISNVPNAAGTDPLARFRQGLQQLK